MNPHVNPRSNKSETTSITIGGQGTKSQTFQGLKVPPFYLMHRPPVITDLHPPTETSCKLRKPILDDQRSQTDDTWKNRQIPTSFILSAHVSPLKIHEEPTLHPAKASRAHWQRSVALHIFALFRNHWHGGIF